jgi:hypothetical protein
MWVRPAECQRKKHCQVIAAAMSLHTRAHAHAFDCHTHTHIHTHSHTHTHTHTHTCMRRQGVGVTLLRDRVDVANDEHEAVCAVLIKNVQGNCLRLHAKCAVGVVKLANAAFMECLLLLHGICSSRRIVGGHGKHCRQKRDHERACGTHTLIRNLQCPLRCRLIKSSPARAIRTDVCARSTRTVDRRDKWWVNGQGRVSSQQ